MDKFILFLNFVYSHVYCLFFTISGSLVGLFDGRTPAHDVQWDNVVYQRYSATLADTLSTSTAAECASLVHRFFPFRRHPTLLTTARMPNRALNQRGTCCPSSRVLLWRKNMANLAQNA